MYTAVKTKKMPNKLCCVYSTRSPQENVDYTKVFSAFPVNSQAGTPLALVVMAGTAVEMIVNVACKTRLKMYSSFSRKWNLRCCRGFRVSSCSPWDLGDSNNHSKEKFLLQVKNWDLCWGPADSHHHELGICCSLFE